MTEFYFKLEGIIHVTKRASKTLDAIANRVQQVPNVDVTNIQSAMLDPNGIKREYEVEGEDV